MHVEQTLECGRVPWGALQNIFEQIGGLLRKAVTREQGDIRQRLRDVFLRLFIVGLFNDRRRRWRNWLLIFINSWRRFRSFLFDGWLKGAAALRAQLIQALYQPLVIFIAVDEFLQAFFSARMVSCSSTDIGKLTQRQRQLMRVARVAAEIDH